MLLRGMLFSVPSTFRKVGPVPLREGSSVAMQEGRFTNCSGTDPVVLRGRRFSSLEYGSREVISLAGKAFAKAYSKQGVKDPAAEQRLDCSKAVRGLVLEKGAGVTLL